jgi:putative membrane-bound dehydrogenase-like protein
MAIRNNEILRLIISCVALLVSGAAAAAAQHSEPKSPREEQVTFRLADPALSIELVAAEPEVTSPVAIAWDEDGRLYVAEMRDYPVGPVSGRVRRLEDRDGDGRYEHATVYADGLPYPNGVMPCFGGLLVTAAPNIWFFRDLDGDGIAEQKKVVLTGFGEGNTQLRVNGLFQGLDNWIYVANGRSDGDVRDPNDVEAKAVSIRRRDLRFRIGKVGAPGGETPKVRAIEAIAGFSQFGLAHDDWDNRFPSWNTVPLRHVVLEQQTLDRNPYLAETLSVASILDMADGGRIFSISPSQARFNRESVAFFNASCGPTIERGGLLPASYHGNAFVCEPLTNVVHRRVLEPAGVTFIAKRVEQGCEFLASSDPAFRPVNLANGPDGALYVVDMYRELVEHPQFVPEDARGTVDFRRWHDRGRIWRVGPKATAKTNGPRPVFSHATAADLVALFSHPNGWYRMTAQRLLVEHRDPAAVPLLIKILKESASPLARLHALYTLAELNGLDQKVMNEVASDPHPALREHALRVVAMLESTASIRLVPTPILVKLAGDRAIRVRLHAAIALGDRCRTEPTALRAMGETAAKDADDPWMRLAILSGLAESSLAFIPLCDRINSATGRAQLLSKASAIVGVRRSMPEIGALLEMIIGRADNQKHTSNRNQSIDALIMLAGLAEGLERSGTGLHDLVRQSPPELRSQLERLAPIWSKALAVIVSNQAVNERLFALDVISRGQPELIEKIVPKLLEVSQPSDIQFAAARAIARSDRPALAVEAIDRWSELALATRRELALALANSPVSARELIMALERQVISPSELDASARETLEHLPDAALRQLASGVFAKFAPLPRSTALARYQPALKLTGDTSRGATVFSRNCQTCHQHQGKGHRVGPDLSGIAGRAPDALLSDVLDPNRDVASDYVALTIATRRGQVVSGLLAEETATTLKVRRAEGIEETILRSEIDELRSTGRSLMPEGIEQLIGLQEMADLIAFLRQGS